MVAADGYISTTEFHYPGADGGTSHVNPGDLVGDDTYAFARRRSCLATDPIPVAVVTTTDFHYLASNGATRHIAAGTLLASTDAAATFRPTLVTIVNQDATIAAQVANLSISGQSFSITTNKPQSQAAAVTVSAQDAHA